MSEYHGPWNLMPRADNLPWKCSVHGPVEADGCQACITEAAEHARACGPSMSCPWWQSPTLCAGCLGFSHCDGIDVGCDCTCGLSPDWADA